MRLTGEAPLADAFLPPSSPLLRKRRLPTTTWIGSASEWPLWNTLGQLHPTRAQSQFRLMALLRELLEAFSDSFETALTTVRTLLGRRRRQPHPRLEAAVVDPVLSATRSRGEQRTYGHRNGVVPGYSFVYAKGSLGSSSKHLGSDGAEDARCAGAPARLRNRPAYRCH